MAQAQYVSVDHDRAGFRAAAGVEQGFGPTPQEALAALMRRLPADASLPIVIYPYNHGDAYFTDTQQARLQDLKGHREDLTAAETAELEGLVAAAFDATIARTQSLTSVKS